MSKRMIIAVGYAALAAAITVAALIALFAR
jgi:hypothetical protein